MWNSLTGEITRKGTEQIHLQCGDCEWDIAMSQVSINALPYPGTRVRVYTWLQHAEDILRLYGFASVQERALFLDLVKVSGVGPKLALKCLSGMKHSEFAHTLEKGDAKTLSRIPGLGLKTAQKIILALKGKLFLEDPYQRNNSSLSELIAALSEMGFDRKACEKVVQELDQEEELTELGPQEKEKLLFQKALVKLST